MSDKVGNGFLEERLTEYICMQKVGEQDAGAEDSKASCLRMRMGREKREMQGENILWKEKLERQFETKE